MENNRTDLYELIFKCKEGDKKSIEILCDKFSTLIKHYNFYLNDEEAYNYLVVTLITCVNNMPIELERFTDDKYILSYIESSIFNSYKRFKMSKSKYNKSLYLIDNITEIESKLPDENCFYDNAIFFIDLKRILSDKEYSLFQLKYQQGLKDKEIAEIYKVSRQAINKSLSKIKFKLKKSYISYYIDT